jgi:hypothetical protein
MFIANQPPKSNSPSPPFLEERAGERRPFARIRSSEVYKLVLRRRALFFWKWRQCQDAHAAQVPCKLSF